MVNTVKFKHVQMYIEIKPRYIKGEGPWEVELEGREKENKGLVIIKFFYLCLIS